MTKLEFVAKIWAGHTVILPDDHADQLIKFIKEFEPEMHGWARYESCNQFNLYQLITIKNP